MRDSFVSNLPLSNVVCRAFPVFLDWVEGQEQQEVIIGRAALPDPS